MLTEHEYKILRERINHFNVWVDSIRPQRICRGCKGTGKRQFGTITCVRCHGKGFTLGGVSYRPEDVPPHVQPSITTNEQKSAVEVYEFRRDKPQRYFVYVSKNANNRFEHATTWTGDILGTITAIGPVYRSPFGDERRSITVQAINGLTYYGTYYQSAGDYARIQAKKGNK